jgi:uncharacterized membrane protein
MSTLTTLGIAHTAISLVALVSGFAALARFKQIRIKDRMGLIYLVSTFLTAATGLGIFQHGGFGPPHVLSILTLLALGVGWAATATTVLGGLSAYVQLVCFSTTVFFHLVPGFTETLTRLPPSAPLLASAEAPQLQAIAAVLLVALITGLVFQIRWLRSGRLV